MGGFLASAAVSRAYEQYDESVILNSSAALAAEYVVHLPAFALLHYIDNRSKYIDPVTSKKDDKKIRHKEVVRHFLCF